MKVRIVIALVIVLSACTTAKVPLSSEFSDGATKMPVKGLNGWMINQKLSFGPFQTSAVKRGWDFSASVQYTKFRLRPEEYVAKVFNIDTYKKTDYQRNRFQYTLEKEGQLAEIYATEKFSEKDLVYKSNNPWIGNTNNTKSYNYSFTAAIIPLTGEKKDPWSLVLISVYDKGKDTARRIFDQPYIQEEGYATDGKETIAISPLRLDNVSTGRGNRKVIGGRMFSGYELRIDNKVMGVVDILDNSVWMQNQLDEGTRFLMASISSAILLKRIQDAKEHDVNE